MPVRRYFPQMLRRVLSLFAFFALTSPCWAVGRGGWDNLKLGMSAIETNETLGAPLIRSVSRGLELWIYDGRAEVLFFRGPVVAWTPPSTVVGGARPPSNDVVLPTRPAAPAPVQKNATPQRPTNSDGYDQLPLYRFRRRQ